MKAVTMLFRTCLILGCIMLFTQPLAAAENSKKADKNPHAIATKEAKTIDELVEMLDEKKMRLMPPRNLQRVGKVLACQVCYLSWFFKRYS